MKEKSVKREDSGAKKKENKYVLICPKCKSPDVDRDNSNPLQSSMGLPSVYVCNKCGHTGHSFPEIPLSELEGFEEDVKKEGIVDSTPDKTPKVDTSYGDFEVRVVWKFGGPFILIIGIVALSKAPVLGTIYILMGLFMMYITYFKKRKLRE